jgi:hypothetical protein
LRIREIDTNNA